MKALKAASIFAVSISPALEAAPGPPAAAAIAAKISAILLIVFIGRKLPQLDLHGQSSQAAR